MWYETELFKTLMAVVVGGLLTGCVSFLLAWWAKQLDIRARADSLRVAFRGEVNALRRQLKADVFKLYTSAVASAAIADCTATYPRVIFEKQAAQIGDLRDPVLAQQLANLYAVLHRVELTGVSL